FRTLFAHSNILQFNPLQLYLAVLPVIPTDTCLYRNVSSTSLMQSGLRVVMGQERAWPAQLAVLRDQGDWVSSVAFSGDGTQVVSGSEDKIVRIWSISSTTCLARLEGHSAPVYSVAWSRDGMHVVSGSHDETLRIWHVGSTACTTVLEGLREVVSSVAFS